MGNQTISSVTGNASAFDASPFNSSPFNIQPEMEGLYMGNRAMSSIAANSRRGMSNHSTLMENMITYQEPDMSPVDYPMMMGEWSPNL